jgi:hypothetical protein
VLGVPLNYGTRQVWSGHVSALDPRLTLIKVWVFFAVESRDPAESGPDLTQGGSGTHPRGPVRARVGPRPYPEVRSVYTGVWYFPMGVQTHC